MTNIQVTEAPSIIRGSHDTATVGAAERQHAGNGRRNLILSLIAAAVAALAVGAVLLARASNSPSDVTPQSPLAAAVQVMDAYAPGGSVYNQQVPAAAALDLSAFAPGGSVYAQQVPSVASADLSAYAPGGSVFEQQVPASAGGELSAYQPGGSVYEQQVPQP